MLIVICVAMVIMTDDRTYAPSSPDSHTNDIYLYDREYIAMIIHIYNDGIAM